MADNGINIGTAYVEILPSTQKFGSSVKQDIAGENKNLEAAGESSGASFSKGFATAAKAATAAFVAQTTAAAAAVKASLEAYGSYEQLVGGVEKLFGEETGQKVIENAQKAFQTAGLSANEYMETVTNFSASLISSLEGDTEAAVSYADMAISDMSDNANTFGTDIASIQTAYQGFAKQNYTMLDNLKLGYGGTKTEMERLIADANALKVAQGGMADLTIERYSDVIEAIHLVQTEMNIAGTTAKEASKTIEGSMNALKGSVKNLWTALGDGKADIKEATLNVVTSFDTMLDNVGPVIEQIADALPVAMDTMVENLPEILPKITDIFNNIVDAGFSIASGFVEALPAILEQIPDLVKNIAQNIFDFIGNIDFGELLGAAFETAGSIIGSLYEVIIGNNNEYMQSWYDHRDAINEFVSAGQAAYDKALELNTQRTETYDSIYAEIGLMEDIKGKLIEYTDEQGHVKEGYEDEMTALVTLAESQGIHIGLIDGEVQGYDDIIKAIDQTIEKRQAEAITAAETQMYEEAYKERRRLDGEYREHYEEYLKNIALAEEARINGDMEANQTYMMLAGEQKVAAESLKDAIVEYGAQMELSSHNMAAAAEGDFDSLATTYDQAGIDIQEYYDALDQTNAEIEASVQDTYGKVIPQAILDGNEKAYAQDVSFWRAEEMLAAGMAELTGQEIDTSYAKGIMEGQKELVQASESTGRAVDDGFRDGIYSGKSGVIEAAGSVMTSAINRAKDIAQIKSPSRVFRNIGDMLMEGLGLGIEENEDNVTGAIETVESAIIGSANDMVDDLNSTVFDVMGTTPDGIDITNQVSGMLTSNLGPEISAETAILGQIAGILDYIAETVHDGKVIQIDGGEMIGALKGRINDALGSIVATQERGVAYV